MKKLNIALLKLSALGDVVWVLPLLSRLEKAENIASIDFITSEALAKLIKKSSKITVITTPKPRSLKDYWRFREQMRDRRYDILLCAQTSLRSNFLYPLIKAERKIGFDSVRSRDGHSFFISESIEFRQEHWVEAFLGFADYLNIPNCPVSFHLLAQKKMNTPLKKPFIVIHPRASSEQRNWPLERYEQLIVQILSRYPELTIYLTGAGNNRNELNNLVQAYSREGRVANLAGKTNLAELAWLLRQARLMIAPDTGPIHLAAAVGTPCVGLYGPMPSELTGPYQKNRYCVDVYQQGFRDHHHREPLWLKRCEDRYIMLRIQVSDVMEKVNMGLEKDKRKK